MTRLRRIVIGASCAVFLAGSSASAADQWRRVRSDHFTVIGNTNADAIRSVDQTLERFRDVLTRALPNAAVSTGETIVVLFKDDASFAPYKPEMPGRSSLGGLFRGSDDVTFLALNAENLAWAMQSTLGGYSQFMVGNTLGRTPSWVSLGISELYRTFQERSGGKIAMLGVPDDRQIAVLRGATLIPLPELLSATLAEPDYAIGQRRRAVFIAESWALVHYLTLSSKERAPLFQNYLRYMRSGDVPAAVAALGDLSALERELNQYVRQFMFPAVQLTFDAAPAKDARREVESVNADEALAYLSGLQATVGNVTAARAALEKTVTASPDVPLASLVLGVVELRSNNTERALSLLAQAASRRPDDGFFQSTYGRALAGSISQPGKPPLFENIEPARKALSKAVELDPQSPVTLAALGRVYLYRPSDPVQAATFLRRAVALSPAREDYQLSLADALLETQDFGAASDILGPLMARGSSDMVRDGARRRLATLSARKAGIAPAPAASSGSAPTAVRVGGGIRPPTKTKDVRPVYPPDAQSAHVEGVVIVEMTIGATGLVTDAKVVRSIPLLDAAAVAAVRQWEFTPTTLNGTPVPVIMTVSVNFGLQGSSDRVP